MKEILRFFLNHHDFKNYFKKEIKTKPKKLVILPGQPVDEEPEEITHTEFLNPVEYKELKGMYDDLNFGEFCMQFINPDEEVYTDRPVTLEEAERLK